MNERHIMIDRDQYEQQVAELCEARAKLARLYEPTPITGEWLVECGGVQVSWFIVDLLGAFDFSGRGIIDIGHGQWELAGLGNYIATRGEFRRAAELLGIQLQEAVS